LKKKKIFISSSQLLFRARIWPFRLKVYKKIKWIC